VEVWQTSDLWPLRLGEEKKEEEDRRKETTGQKYNGPPLLHRAAITRLIITTDWVQFRHNAEQPASQEQHTHWYSTKLSGQSSADNSSVLFVYSLLT